MDSCQAQHSEMVVMRIPTVTRLTHSMVTNVSSSQMITGTHQLQMSGETSTIPEVTKYTYVGCLRLVFLYTEICNELGGFLPHDYSGFSGRASYGDEWHWVGYGADDQNCYACRPNSWRQGVRAFPCSTQLAFGCERRRAYPLPLPRRRPRIWTPQAVRHPSNQPAPRRRHGLGPVFRNSFFGGRSNYNANVLLRSNPYLQF